MSIRRTLSLSALLCCTLPVAAQVYRCPDAGGRTVIQQMPCQGGAQMDVRPSRGITVPSSADAGEAQVRLEKLKRDNETAAAIRRGEPLVGMTVDQLRGAMGAPNKVNAANYSGTRKDQLIYYREDATWYVYTTNDVVESIQRSGPTPSTQPQAPVRCATSREIRDAEVSASSMMLSEQERRDRMKMIEDMRNCRHR